MIPMTCFVRHVLSTLAAISLTRKGGSMDPEEHVFALLQRQNEINTKKKLDDFTYKNAMLVRAEEEKKNDRTGWCEAMVMLEKRGYWLWSEEVKQSSWYCKKIHPSIAGANIVSRNGKDPDSGRVILLDGECLQCRHEYLVDGCFEEKRCSYRFLVSGNAVAQKLFADSADFGDELDDGVALFGEDDGRLEGGNAAPAAQLPRNQQPEVATVEYAELVQRGKELFQDVTTVAYAKLLQQGKALFSAVAGLPFSLHVSASLLNFTRLAHNGGLTEGTSQEIVRDAAKVFGGDRKRRKIGNPSTDTNSVSPFVGRMARPGHPQQHRIHGPKELPAPAEKRKASCGFCGSNMRDGGHSRINICPQVKAIGTFLKGHTQNEFAEKFRKLVSASCQ
jgi:hypothetical protein